MKSNLGLLRDVMRGAAIIQLLSFALLLLFVAGACLERGGQGKWGWGRTITINVTPTQKLEQVAYSDGGKHYVIRPKDAANLLALSNVTIVNDKSARVLILANSKAALLEDSDNKQYEAVDPYAQREQVPEPPSSGNRYLPFLWGPLEISQGYQVKGWMLFEVPKKAQITRFLWEETDTVRVSYK